MNTLLGKDERPSKAESSTTSKGNTDVKEEIHDKGEEKEKKVKETAKEDETKADWKKNLNSHVSAVALF